MGSAGNARKCDDLCGVSIQEFGTFIVFLGYLCARLSSHSQHTTRWSQNKRRSEGCGPNKDIMSITKNGRRNLFLTLCVIEFKSRQVSYVNTAIGSQGTHMHQLNHKTTFGSPQLIRSNPTPSQSSIPVWAAHTPSPQFPPPTSLSVPSPADQTRPIASTTNIIHALVYPCDISTTA